MEQAVTELVQVQALQRTKKTQEQQKYHIIIYIIRDDLISTGFLKKTLHGI